MEHSGTYEDTQVHSGAHSSRLMCSGTQELTGTHVYPGIEGHQGTLKYAQVLRYTEVLRYSVHPGTPCSQRHSGSR